MLKRKLFCGIIVFVIIIAFIIQSAILQDSDEEENDEKIYPEGMIFRNQNHVNISYIMYIEDSLSNGEYPLVVVPDPDGTNDQQYAFWIIYNRTGLQICDIQPVDVGVENIFSLTFPPDPPYLVYGRISSLGSIQIQFNKQVTVGGAFTLYQKEGKINRHVTINSGGIQGETTFTLNETTYVLYHALDYGKETGSNPYGTLSVVEPTDRTTFYVHDTPTGRDFRLLGPSGLRGEWRLRLELDEPSILVTDWWINSKIRYIDPSISELGFEFSNDTS